MTLAERIRRATVDVADPYDIDTMTVIALASHTFSAARDAGLSALDAHEAADRVCDSVNL